MRIGWDYPGAGTFNAGRDYQCNKSQALAGQSLGGYALIYMMPIDDEENPEWTREEIRRAHSFDKLPMSVREKFIGTKESGKATETPPKE